MRLVKFIRLALLAGSITLVFGCGETGSSSADSGAAKAAALMPADPDLAAIYRRSCKSCHGIGVANIPQSGDAEAWQPRVAKGMEELMDSVIDGFGGMPPLGMCMDCEPEEYEALIRFMVGAAADQLEEGK